MLMSTTVFASDVKLIVDGKEAKMDVPPKIVNGGSYVPIRALLENRKNYEEYTVESRGSKSDFVMLNYTPEYKWIDRHTYTNGMLHKVSFKI